MTSKRAQSGYSNAIVRAVTVIAIAVLFVVPGLTAAATRGKANAEQAKIPFPRPQSHAANWLEYHGRAVTPAMNADGSIGNNCQTCHEKTDCVTCHMTTPPRDHTN